MKRSQVATLGLHTSVIYLKDKNSLSFASISPSNEHGPPAIWAHLQPVLELLRKEFPDVDVLYFFPDGPSTQYRQEKNFYLFSKLIFNFGFQAGTWSFFAGAVDGIGATLKRCVDQAVAHGTDIPDAETLFYMLEIQV
ncbi:hypothetical protein AVEN_195927-1 [Araneus ventricosus]|uniref:Uncharacterized protein n=1 Tax=Araneus ventricosus TaxID=182803 RepID=A0A4Y2I043_ARAVE|nr:hypothetical protein AVEN_195927-1 [Araneus ventricosus]